MHTLKDDNFYIVYTWMPRLGLRGTALAVYAVIYGYTSRGRAYRGSAATLAQYVGAGKSTVLEALRKLIEMDLVRRAGIWTAQDGSRFPVYMARRPEEGRTETERSRTETERGRTENRPGAHRKPDPIKENNSIGDRMDNNIISSAGGLTEKEKAPKGAERSEYDEEFASVWALYPRKQGRATARNAYFIARRSGVTEAEIRRGIEAYNRYIELTGTQPNFIRQGGNWFKSRSWEDAAALSHAANAVRNAPAPDRAARGRRENRALNYNQRRYTKAQLKALGIDFGEDDD